MEMGFGNQKITTYGSATRKMGSATRKLIINQLHNEIELIDQFS